MTALAGGRRATPPGRALGAAADRWVPAFASRWRGHALAGKLRGRAFAGAALVVAVAGAALSGCGTAPYAATVNGQAISVQQLAAQAREWASSPAFVKVQDAEFAAQASSAIQSGQTNVPTETVEGNGTGTGVYGMYWTTLELSNMVTSIALHQYLAARHELPSAEQVQAAWSAEWAENPTVWDQVGPAARQSGALYDAERAQLVAVVDAKADASFYASHRDDFWSSVCLLSEDVTVSSSSGAVDFPASKAEADKVAGALEANPTSPPASVANGSRYCDSPEQLIEQPQDFQSAVLGLAPGRAAVLRENWGYQVVQVTSRQQIPYSGRVAGDIEVVVSDGGAQGQPNSETKVIGILKRAKVRVNPAFGTWATNLPAPYAPEVLPPGSSA